MKKGERWHIRSIEQLRSGSKSPSRGETQQASGPSGGEPRRKRTADKTGGVQSLRRALSIMKVIAAAGDGVTLTEIARATDLASSTVHRLLTTLQQDRFIQFK